MSILAIPLVRLKHVRVRVQQISRGISLIDARARLKPAHRLQKLAKTSVFTCLIAQEQKNCAGNDNAARNYISSNLGSNRCIHGAPSTE